MICSFCNKETVLQPYNGRPNAQCPKCKALERHRDLGNYIRDVIPEGGTNWLWVAPINKEICKALAESKGCTRYNGIDLSGQRGDVMDVQNMSFIDGDFDVAVCYHVLEHVDDDDQALSEIHRVLKPNGLLLFQVPMGGKVGVMGHKRVYEKNRLEAWLSDYFYFKIIYDEQGRDYFYVCKKVD